MVEEMEKDRIEEEVSAIEKTILLDNSKSSIHFETHKQENSRTKDQSYEAKRTRVLRARNGKEVKLDLNHLNPNQPV